MEEFRRQAYLKAMGIPVWLPKCQLPNASEAFLLDYTPPELQASRLKQSQAARVQEKPTIKQTEKERSRPVSDAKNLMRVIAGTDNKDKKAAERKPKAAASTLHEKKLSPPTAAESKGKKGALQGSISKPPVFSLLMMRLSPTCLVVSDCGLGEESAVQSEREGLLLNMLKATFKTDFVVERCDFCHWPLVKNPQVDQGPLIAQQAVAQLVATRCQGAQAFKVVLMGRSTETYASGFPVYMNESVKPKVITVKASLDDLLTEPQRKREAWSDIKRCLEA